MAKPAAAHNILAHTGVCCWAGKLKAFFFFFSLILVQTRGAYRHKMSMTIKHNGFQFSEEECINRIKLGIDGKWMNDSVKVVC